MEKLIQSYIFIPSKYKVHVINKELKFLKRSLIVNFI